ncbi:hypothetical protein [Helcococcus bovis]|uniref:Phage structural protein n=1 Tax=Helcococcus bovis TaxID=3153252 RepID=A0ABW9F6R3_9FIRM
MSGSFNTNAYEVRYLTFEWSVASQNVATNQTTINWKLRGNGTNPYTWYMSGNFKVVIEGRTVYQSETRIQLTGTTTVASGQYTITHNADGNKTFNASCEAGIYYYAVNARGSGSWALPMIARATQPSVNKTSMAFGESIIISTPRASTTFTHTVQASVDGKLNYTNIATNIATSFTYTLPKTWARYLTHSTDKLRIRVLTYSGSQRIGTKEAPLISVRATSDMTPVVNIALTDANNFYTTYGGFVKGKSKIRAKVTETLYEQAVVTTRSLLLNGITYQSNDQTSEIIKSTTQRIEAKVTDSRGLTGTKVVTPIVYDWYEPKITMIKANRCQSNGTIDETGNHIKLEYACAVAPVNNKNKKTLSYSYRQLNQSTQTTRSIIMDTFSKSGSVIFPASGENTWEVSIQLTDAFTTSRAVVNVGTAFVLLDFHKTGKGIGVGKVSEEPLLFDLSPSWTIGYKGSQIADFIESTGTTFGWRWRKWNSGLMEMTTRKQVTIDIKTKWGGLFVSGAITDTNLTYPFTFKDVPTLIVNLSSLSWVGFLVNATGHPSTTSNTGAFQIARGVEATNANYILNYYAIGRWK